MPIFLGAACTWRPRGYPARRSVANAAVRKVLLAGMTMQLPVPILLNATGKLFTSCRGCCTSRIQIRLHLSSPRLRTGICSCREVSFQSFEIARNHTAPHFTPAACIRSPCLTPPIKLVCPMGNDNSHLRGNAEHYAHTPVPQNSYRWGGCLGCLNQPDTKNGSSDSETYGQSNPIPEKDTRKLLHRDLAQRDEDR